MIISEPNSARNDISVDADTSRILLKKNKIATTPVPKLDQEGKLKAKKE